MGTSLSCSIPVTRNTFTELVECFEHWIMTRLFDFGVMCASQSCTTKAKLLAELQLHINTAVCIHRHRHHHRDHTLRFPHTAWVTKKVFQLRHMHITACKSPLEAWLALRVPIAIMPGHSDWIDAHDRRGRRIPPLSLSFVHMSMSACHRAWNLLKILWLTLLKIVGIPGCWIDTRAEYWSGRLRRTKGLVSLVCLHAYVRMNCATCVRG